ncbi:hypothetical protein LTR78_006419 [Recurvomyces mirabilis]|uniref:BZIP domain-containing protein n=1 Tax=Recurvomyces mirabilis TaxID=574656 RepID=A0AAE0WLF3_9PEZI|nr:hypothetical protein LTR78_006419 [Recurvomyces mirabilis]KAK5152306.1 hypothetical protein LTS14_008683 [Recurvomyces mirabilis]
MASYNGRRAPNVSQYLANLNTIPGPQDVAAQSAFPTGDDLDFLTNTEFFDFDNFEGIGDEFGQGAASAQANEKAAQKAGSSAVATNGPGYQFSEFQTYPTMTASPVSAITSPSNLQGAFPALPSHFSPGEKRSASQAGLASVDLEDPSRFIAEEDKRRRNTAASARFRVKKKQREQALEKQSKDMSEKVQMLEGKVQQLEMENKWLKELITEKTKDSEKADAEGKNASETKGDRSREERTDGVGTVADVKVAA